MHSGPQRTNQRDGGDSISGDKILEDKIQGDKVGGDKIVYMRSQEDDLDDFLEKAVSRFETRMFQLVHLQTVNNNPYKFLYPFQIEDAGRFFGREKAVEELLDTIQKDRLTILHGPSGAGKTSILNAGLSPPLINNYCLPVYARAYEDPITAIKQTIIPSSISPWPEQFNYLGLNLFLGMICQHLSRQIKELVIILDQFEEFFIFPPRETIKRPFIADLASCIHDQNLPVRFIISIRKDYYSDLSALKDEIPTIFFNEYRLKSMNRPEAKMAVVGPIILAKSPVTYEPALLDLLLDDLDQGGIELPHLQIICSQLFHLREKGQNLIAIEDYNKLNGAKGILGSYLNNELCKFPVHQSEIAKEILKELVSSEATKRVLSFQSIVSRIKVDKEIIEDTLTKLVQARLLQRWETAGIISYEMAHEYLINEIGLWIDRSDLDFKLMEELLARETTTWRVHGTLIPEGRLSLMLPFGDRFQRCDSDSRLVLYLSALKHRSEDVRVWAADCLEQLRDSRAIEPLLYALTKYYGKTRDSVTRALASMGEPAVAPLLEALNDEKVQVRSSATEALGKIGKQALEPLIEVLQSENVQSRRNAARALGLLGDRQAVKPLIKALQDSDSAVRYMSAIALANLGDKQAVDSLIIALEDSEWRVRDRSAKALGILGDLRAVKPLVGILQDSDSRVRERALEALKSLKEVILALKVGGQPDKNLSNF